MLKLHILDLGYLYSDYYILNGLPTYGFPAPNGVEMGLAKVDPVYCVLIETDEGPILFDTGCHPESMTTRWPQWNRDVMPCHTTAGQNLLLRLKEKGYKPEDIRMVVASHLHEDHAGGLEFFPNATTLVHEDEYRCVMALYECGEGFGSYISKDIEAWHSAGLKWRFIRPSEDGIPLAKGVTLLNFGSGHTFGLLGLKIDLPETGCVLLASDAFPASGFLKGSIPSAGYDSIGFVRTIRRIRDLAEANKATVWCGHDRVQYQALLKHNQGVFS